MKILTSIAKGYTGAPVKESGARIKEVFKKMCMRLCTDSDCSTAARKFTEIFIIFS
jgi:hypothetical protein